jgi:hypothetical protein
MGIKNSLGKIVLTGALALGVAGCGKEEKVLNMKQYTADFIGDQNGYVAKWEKRGIKTLTNMAKKEGHKYIYMPFIIDEKGDVKTVNPFHIGDTVPQGRPNYSREVSECRGFSDEEIKCMMRDGKKLPNGREWTEKDYINNFGYKEINQDGEISNTYLLKESGMEKQ